MRTILQGIKRQLHRLDDENDDPNDDATPLTLIVDALVFVVPTVAVVMGIAFAVYFSV